MKSPISPQASPSPSKPAAVLDISLLSPESEGCSIFDVSSQSSPTLSEIEKQFERAVREQDRLDRFEHGERENA